MNIKLSNLFEDVLSEEDETSQEAILSLSCILEMHSWNLSLEDREHRFSIILKQEHQELTGLFLDVQNLLEIINFLASQIRNNHKHRLSMFAAMGKASDFLALKPLVSVFDKEVMNLNEDELYQAINSLDRLLFFATSLSESSQRGILNDFDILTKVSEKILMLQFISHSDLTSMALKFICRLIVLFNRNGVDSDHLDLQ